MIKRVAAGHVIGWALTTVATLALQRTEMMKSVRAKLAVAIVQEQERVARQRVADYAEAQRQRARAGMQ